jgi:hypothetical protein
MRNMTGWFPSNTKPVHAGVYEVQTPNHKGNKYCYYDQHGWRLCSDRIDYAEQEKHYKSTFMRSSMLLVGSKWRGFKEKQT